MTSCIMPNSRAAFSVQDKQWWKDLFENSDFNGKEAKARFLRQVEREVEMKGGILYAVYKKKKNRNGNFGIPLIGTFRKWYLAPAAVKIHENRTSNKKKNRKAYFPELDALLYDFINRAESFLSEHRFGLSWEVISEQAKVFAGQLRYRGIMSQQEHDGVKASHGYLDRLKRRKDLHTVKLQGELNSMSDEAYDRLIGGFRTELKALMDLHNIPKALVFNADQTALYYRRFPCTAICSKERASTTKGTKAMKDKDQITSMVCTSSEGIKCPVGYVGKSKNPRCFLGQQLPRYTANPTAWFNKGTTVWWFRDVFAPFFNAEFRTGDNVDAHCCVILDNCSAHASIQEWLDANGYNYIHIIKLPPNVTSRHQPMDQGVIAWTKKTYKYQLCLILLKSTLMRTR